MMQSAICNIFVSYVTIVGMNTVSLICGIYFTLICLVFNRVRWSDF